MPTDPAYRYTATVLRVIDGDTLSVNVDLGFHLTLRAQTIRLAACNAREFEQPGGPEASANLTQLLPPSTVVTLSTVRADKFGGRYDAHITLADGTDLVSKLIDEGWAAAWDGEGPKPVPPWPRQA